METSEGAGEERNKIVTLDAEDKEARSSARGSKERRQDEDKGEVWC